MMAKNPFRQIAYSYSGRLWLLWAMALTQSMLALVFLFFQGHHSTPLTMWLGGLSSLVALCYYGSIIYYLTHRVELAANPAKPTDFTLKQVVIWVVAITLIVIAVFVALVLFVWKS